MTDANKPLLLTIAAAGIFVAVLLTSQPYSSDWPGGGYTKSAQRYIRAALQQDSQTLTRLSANARPVAWALRTSRLHHEDLAHWKGRTQAWTGARAGDTTEVFLYPSGEVCEDSPIYFHFIGAGRNARVASISAPCIDPDR